ncbi:MAG: hypothetical protein AB7P76_03160 [Candidatus Melainabacteria bacterium]
MPRKSTRAQDKQKFASQADPTVLAELRRIADSEGRQFQALVDEAFRDFIEKKTTEAPRSAVMKAFEASLAEYGELYQKLAQ